MYENQRNYLIGSGLSVAACGLAILGVWIHAARRLLRRLCFAPLVAMMALTAYQWLVDFE